MDAQSVVWSTDAKIRKLYSNGDFIYLGLEDAGCYITTQYDFSLLESNNTIFSMDDTENFETFYAIADGFTVYNIQYFINIRC